MGKIIYLGTELDSSLEHELMAEKDSFGFKVIATYKDGRKEIHNNCTEVHWRFSTVLARPEVAFESDIHSTGRICHLERLESVSIEKAEVLCEDF